MAEKAQNSASRTKSGRKNPPGDRSRRLRAHSDGAERPLNAAVQMSRGSKITCSTLHNSE
eukprot:IDg6151t1